MVVSEPKKSKKPKSQKKTKTTTKFVLCVRFFFLSFPLCLHLGVQKSVQNIHDLYMFPYPFLLFLYSFVCVVLVVDIVRKPMTVIGPVKKNKMVSGVCLCV